MDKFAEDVNAKVQVKLASILGGDGTLNSLLYGLGGAALGGVAGARFGSPGMAALGTLGGLGGYGISNAINTQAEQNQGMSMGQLQALLAQGFSGQ